MAAAHAWAALTHSATGLEPAAYAQCLKAADEISKAASYALGAHRAHAWKQYALKVRRETWGD